LGGIIVIHNLAEDRKSKFRLKHFDLDERDMRMLKMICDGRTSLYISYNLPTSKKNVDLLRTKLMRKLNVHSANELIRTAILYKLYTPRTNAEIEQELIDEQNAALERRLHNLKQNSMRNLEDD
jgi:DNA-binding CsgD family transcriptional regulator